jgi:hypothetical protein
MLPTFWRRGFGEATTGAETHKVRILVLALYDTKTAHVER